MTRGACQQHYSDGTQRTGYKMASKVHCTPTACMQISLPLKNLRRNIGWLGRTYRCSKAFSRIIQDKCAASVTAGFKKDC
jgi:hypothetical protein